MMGRCEPGCARVCQRAQRQRTRVVVRRGFGRRTSDLGAGTAACDPVA